MGQIVGAWDSPQTLEIEQQLAPTLRAFTVAVGEARST